MVLKLLYDDTGSVDGGGTPLQPQSQGGMGPVAQSFSSGSAPITLTDIKLVLDDGTPSDGGSVRVELFSSVSNAPGTLVSTLGTIGDSSLTASARTIDTIISSSPTLTANTTYWIELVPTAASNAEWDFTAGPTGTGTSGQSSYYDGTSDPASAQLMSLTGNQLCFAAGTRILTAQGEIAVEHLREGDLAVAVRGACLAPIVWIGHRRVDLRAHPDPASVNPIRIRQHAFGPGRPHSDLIVSPNHALYVDGHLITARYLLNGATIVQEPWDSVAYYHVELDSHDVLLANGLAAESFLDVGNRAAFLNGGEPPMLHPDFARTQWDAHACAPSLPKGEELASLRQTLLDRALTSGHATTQDADLLVFAGGRLLQPQPVGQYLLFDLRFHPGQIRLNSRTGVPSNTQPGHPDGRTLGVGITSLLLDSTVIALDNPCLTRGWHTPEPGLRWTKGNAEIDPGQAKTLALRLFGGLTYWASPQQAEGGLVGKVGKEAVLF